MKTALGAYVVLQLTLEAAEGHGPSPAAFWEEVLLALHLNMDYQAAVGYARRQYANGRRISFLLKGWIQAAKPASPRFPLRIQGARYLLPSSGLPRWGTIVKAAEEATGPWSVQGREL